MSEDDRGIELRKLLNHPDKVERFAKGVVCFAILGWLACAFSPVIFGVSSATSGPWGDTFGAASSFFSLFTLIGLAYTILIQHEELRTARADAKESEAARLTAERLMVDQAKALIVSAKLNALNSLAQCQGQLVAIKASDRGHTNEAR